MTSARHGFVVTGPLVVDSSNTLKDASEDFQQGLRDDWTFLDYKLSDLPIIRQSLFEIGRFQMNASNRVKSDGIASRPP